MSHGTYDPHLVALSVLIAAFAGYTALDLARSVGIARGHARKAWLAGGSVAMGVGIWSMHFIGTLAFRMPGMTISYDITLLAVSIIVAVAASSIALYVVSRERVSLRALVGAGLAMAAAISGMHYIGIAGMRMVAAVTWNPVLVMASIVIAIAAAFAALWLSFRFRRDDLTRRVPLQLMSAMAMGIAIAGMHYTAMAAMRFTPLAGGAAVNDADVLATDGLTVAVASGTLMILLIALAGSIMQRALARRSMLAERNDRLFRAAEQRASEEESLRRATEVVATAFTLEDVLNEIVKNALGATAADTAYIEHIDRDSNEVTVAAATGPRHPPLGLSIPFADSSSARVERENQTVVEAEMSSLPSSLVAAFGQHRGASLIAVPLRDEQTLIAVLVVARRPGQPAFRPDETTRAKTFSHLASLAFRRLALVREEERRRQELEQAERLAAVGRLTSSVAHEFNNILMSIQAFTDVAHRAASLEQFQRAVPHINRAVARGKNITAAVLRLTVTPRPQRDTLDLCAWLNGLRERLEALTGPTIALEIRADHGPIIVSADREQLAEVLVSVTKNVHERIAPGGRLTIAIARDTNKGSKNPAEPLIRLVVSDTTPGLTTDSTSLERLFTTKEQALSLGLAISYEVVRAHGGSMFIQSDPGEAAAVHILLPEQNLAESGSAARREATPESNVTRIVLVEDDDTVAEGLTLMMEMSGFQVCRVARGSDALGAVADFEPDAVVLDLGLPDMDGLTVYHGVDAHFPRMPVVFATGHGDETALRSVLERPNVSFLRKPFDSDALIAAIERAAAG